MFLYVLLVFAPATTNQGVVLAPDLLAFHKAVETDLGKTEDPHFLRKFWHFKYLSLVAYHHLFNFGKANLHNTESLSSLST